ncbi:hypothetical protein VT84_09375 [Gemmata sp. SH-PL17]|uniref:hypothetical protein n=1 Tax=Gemmata sp. SH-PL17 TaxID=1630693 RepID=UPI00078ED668|nr:hypothetical protein [Gemmata sp. SH-PL17]AMV24594.1 hypothetical protein VT84_09375 [Gemmata sp. SH-PL17]
MYPNQDLENWLIKITEWTRRTAEALEKNAGAGGSGSGNGSSNDPKNTFLTGLTTGAGKLLGVFAALEKSVTSFGSALARFVGQASPVTIMRWNQALADAQAVIGRALIPILERMTGAVRAVADAFVNLSPQAQRLLTGLGVGAGLGAAIGGIVVAVKAAIAVFGGVPVAIGALVAAFVGVASTMDSGKSIFEAFKAALGGAVSVIEALALAITPLIDFVITPVLRHLAEEANKAAVALRDFVNDVREMVGKDKLPENKSSVGAAVRGAQIGDIQSYINRAYTSAFSAGVGKSVEEKQLEELKGIRAVIDKSGYAPNSDSWASSKRGGEQVGKWVGAPETGRRIGRLMDYAHGPVTLAPRAIVETLRQLFG